MPSDPFASDAPIAFVFPGQGAHGSHMLEPFRHAPRFGAHYERVAALLGRDPLKDASRDPEVLNQNAVSSLLTVLGSVLGLELAREQGAPEPAAFAGYSVGQWTALYAAGAISVEDLFVVVAERARLMDACLVEAEPSGMLAVIGVRADDVEAICEAVTATGELLQIANYNAPGQLTLSGSEAGLAQAEERLAPLRPKRLARVPVAGAWHSPLLNGAVEPLAALLAGVPIEAPAAVIDNVTGTWLPRDPAACRAALARHVAQPVRWMQGVRTLAEAGIRTVIEIGHGDVLTKFGFFIDRSLRHRAQAPLPRLRG